MPTVKKVAADIRKFEKGFNNIARKILKEEGEKLLLFIKRTKFRSAGEPGPKSIVSRTGALEASLKAVTRFKGGGIRLSISYTGVQARILEEGGKTRAHVIRPKKPGGLLVFFWPKVDAWVFFKKVNHPGSLFKARRILERSFEQRSTQIAKNVENAMLKEWERRV